MISCTLEKQRYSCVSDGKEIENIHGLNLEKIDNVYVVELNKTIKYPLATENIPPELVNYKANEEDTYSGAFSDRGFHKLLGFGTFGYSSPSGDYYTGYNSGTVFRLGLHYYLPETDRTASRFLFGFSFFTYF